MDIHISRMAKHLPYTIIGHTSLNPEFSITFTRDGLQSLVGQMKQDEFCSVTVRDGKPNKIEIHRKR